MESTAFNQAGWNPLHLIGMHFITLHGIYCIQLGSIAPRCMESTAFNQNPLHHTAWNPLHSLEIHWATLHRIHCIQSGSIKPRCMEYTGFNRDAFYHAASNPLHSVMPHGTTAFNWDNLGLTP